MGMVQKGLLAAVCLVPLSAGAVDGVIEINHARAMAGGVTNFDAPGYPVSITQPGSYRLTGNLTQPDGNTHVIHVIIRGVTIDLNGFNIMGASNCRYEAGPLLTCDQQPQLAGNGIHGEGPGLIVSNGSIIGVGGSGVHLTTGIARDLFLARNGFAGLRGSGQVINVVAENNFAYGITGIGFSAQGLLNVRDSVARLNGVGFAYVAVGANLVANHNHHGFQSAEMLDGCSAFSNRGYGLNAVRVWRNGYVGFNTEGATTHPFATGSFCEGLGCP